jgi:hypothetical protein
MRKLLITFSLLLACLASDAYAPAILDSRAYQDRNDQWQNFRNRFRYHIQLIAVKKYTDNSVNIILTEPPNRIKQADIQTILKGLDATLEVKRWQVGVDGWVKDAIISATNLSAFRLNNLLAELNELLFHTSYKAEYLDLEKLPRTAPLSSLNYQVTAAELNKWFLVDNESFYPVGNKGKNFSVRNILTSRLYGEYFSHRNRFVLWVVPSVQDISRQQRTIRNFALDADLIIGAIYGNNTLAVIGRKRKESVYALPPLRTESVLMLAAANKRELAQSYERTSLFAGKMTNEKDWAPIYLSGELINSEYGSLLNITDQMLKSWSQKGQIKYENFSYPKPSRWPFPRTIFDEIGSSRLTYNWNTRGVGYAVSTGSLQVYAVNRTGSLPVSYFPDSSEVNQNLTRYEDGAYQYFSSLNDPNLVRVGQYTFLYQIFSAFNITASTNYLNTIQEPRDVLTEPTVNLFKKIINRDESAMVGLMFRPDTRAASELFADLRTYYRRYAEAGLREIAKLANDREALFQIDRSYFRIVRLIREHDQLVVLINSYVTSRNAIVPRHNVLGANPHRTSAEEAERIRLDADIRSYDRLIAPLNADLARMKNEVITLTGAADERLKLRTRILERISLVGTLVDWDFGLRDSIKQLYSLAHEMVNNATWIKTPSIVVSQDTLHVNMVGGHNLAAAIDRFILDVTVARGSIKMATVNGTRVLKINPADVSRVNSSFLKDLRYANSRASTANAITDLQRSFASNPPPPPRNVDNVVRVAEPDGPSYDPKSGIGWTYDDAKQASNVLVISKSEDGYYWINNKKTATCYNLREAIEDYLKTQPEAMGTIEFANFSDEEVRYFSQNVAARLNTGNTARNRWKVYRGKTEAVTAKDYDFDKKIIDQLDNGNIRITIPKKETSRKILVDLVGVTKNMFKAAKDRIEKVLNLGKSSPTTDIVSGLIAEFKAAGIPLSKVIVSADDCTFCIIITCNDEGDS